ncbi:PepSY domain-containing protein [Elizabethkingia sp. JS20170427COW]|uniref:PepSY-associated TM helix domain-containing protein n=1 Tax=Elizabethkingia sp. JS20170427COW TaxID=2583851 RepID=UPI0011104E28|nr:PepSY-associated TM helix domain-containing protein [Elizabethkingia sp. JS20170427COW]QCX53738.1 PepSY domain-containing protein [Elizabethkingia sp. JS20170427COW]
MKKKHHHKKSPGFIKKWASKLHLWLGLSVGLIIFIVSITGALFVFKDEIENFQRKDFIFHHEKNIEQKKLLSLHVLEQKVNEQVKSKYPVHWVNIPMDKSRSYRFYWYEHNINAWNYFDEYPIYQVAYVNPYNGQVLKVYDEKNGFFQIVKSIHWSFLLKESWGKYVVGIPVVIFIVMLISGIILWWPKNKAARKQRFSFQWKNVKNWKRKNYDVHNIFGFYSSILALVFAITGLFYSFFVVQAAIYFVFSGGKTALPDYSQYTTTAPVEQRTVYTLDKVAERTREVFPNAFAFNIHLGHPHLDDHEHPNFEVYVQQLSYSYHQFSSIIFDENSGELLKTIYYKDKNFGEKAVGANYDIHVGSILGLPTKIIAFIISLMIASLPVTGFMIWWGRRKKKK